MEPSGEVAGKLGSATPLGAWRSAVSGLKLLDRSVLEAGAEEAARDLLGCRLVSLVGDTVTGGRIVETEAYVGPHDPACHAAERTGRTRRNAPMYGRPGTAYLYFVYGMHWCFNVVTGRVGQPEAVLIRALEPAIGREAMSKRRDRDRDLTNGPAKLCSALGIDGELNEHCLSRPPLLLYEGSPRKEETVGVTGRVGIRRARDWPLRFLLEGNPHVSSPSPRPPRSGARME